MTQHKSTASDPANRDERKEPKSATKKVLIAISIALGIVLVGLFLSCVGSVVWVRLDERAGENRVRMLEEDFRTNVPIGSSRDVVKAWFDSQGIEYSIETFPAKNPGYRADFADPRFGDVLRSKKILIDLQFDDRDRLKRFMIVRGVEAGTF